LKLHEETDTTAVTDKQKQMDAARRRFEEFKK
jgi:hypothetical protein